jgi:hypothetical protein
MAGPPLSRQRVVGEGETELLKFPNGCNPLPVDVAHVDCSADSGSRSGAYAVSLWGTAMWPRLPTIRGWSFCVRYKCWRSNKDKDLHLLCARARRPLRHCLRRSEAWDLGPAAGKVKSPSYGFPTAFSSLSRASRSCTATSRSWRWKPRPSTRCIRPTPNAQSAREPGRLTSTAAYESEAV